MSPPNAPTPRLGDPIPASIGALLHASDASVVTDIERETEQVTERLAAATRRRGVSIVPATPHQPAQAIR